jgi:hypothetical protein
VVLTQSDHFFVVPLLPSMNDMFVVSIYTRSWVSFHHFVRLCESELQLKVFILEPSLISMKFSVLYSTIIRLLNFGFQLKPEGRLVECAE